MKTFSIAVTAAVAALASGLLSVAPAGATDGSTAVDMCKKLAGCIYDIGARGDIILITDDGHVITCPSADDECAVTGRPANVGGWQAPAAGGPGTVGTYQPPQSLIESESSAGEVAASPAGPGPAPGPGPIL